MALVWLSRKMFIDYGSSAYVMIIYIIKEMSVSSVVSAISEEASTFSMLACTLFTAHLICEHAPFSLHI